MIHCCPECGQTLPGMPDGIRVEDNHIFAGGERYRVTMSEARTFAAIASRHPRAVNIHDILEAAYGLEADWPDNTCIRVNINKIRAKTAGAPFAIEAVRGAGYRLLVLNKGQKRPNPRHYIRWV